VLGATPVIDKEAGIIYVSTSDGKLRGLSIVDGEDKMPAVDFTNPFARNWSLNLIDGVIYSPTARGCFSILSHFTAYDLKIGRRQEFYSGPGTTSGAWGRGGLVKGPKYIYAQTADGPYDPAGGKFGNTVIALTFKNLRLVDTYTPENWEYLNTKDLDLSSAGAVVFPFRGKNLVASVGKESVVTLLDADNLGGAGHPAISRTPLWGHTPSIADENTLSLRPRPRFFRLDCPQPHDRYGHPAHRSSELHVPPLSVVVHLDAVEELLETMGCEGMDRHDPFRIQCSSQPLEIWSIRMARRVMLNQWDFVLFQELEQSI